MGADFESEDFGPGGVPDPAERTWRHPSEISAAARAEQAPTHVVSNSGLRVPPSVLLIAAGLAIGVVMAGYFIGDQRSTIPAETAAKTAATLPSGTETTTTSQALQTTTQLTVLGTDDSASVGTQGLITQIRARAVSRPEGVLTIYLDDETTAIASGITANGLILTSASALGANRTVKVSSARGSVSMVTAEVLGSDPFSDLAVLEPDRPLEEYNLTSSEIGSTSGDEDVMVIAGGEDSRLMAPLGKVLQWGTSAMSASGHEMVGLASTSLQLGPNDPGGGLFDTSGHVIGLVLNTKSHLASVLPFENAMEIANSISAHGWASPVWVGIGAVTNPAGGVVVINVVENGPAQVAGIEVGDVIMAIDRNAVSSVADFVHYVRGLSKGSGANISVSRGADQIVFEVELGWRD